jgi:hypothetical protein
MLYHFYENVIVIRTFESLPASVQDYWSVVHPALADGYSDPNYPGEHVIADCEIIAYDLKRLLAAENEDPRILHFSYPDQRGFRPRNVPYDWVAHIVCALGTYVCDPIFSEPMDVSPYIATLFPNNLDIPHREVRTTFPHRPQPVSV